MKIYIIISIVLWVYVSSYGQEETVYINIIERDTAYFNNTSTDLLIGKGTYISGTAYDLANPEDSVYLELKSRISFDYEDMGCCVYCIPYYEFKPDTTNRIYYIYKDNLLHEVVQYKSNEIVHKSVYDYYLDYYDYRIFNLPIKYKNKQDCKEKQNMGDVVVHKTEKQYINGEEVDSQMSEYLHKENICAMQSSKDKNMKRIEVIYRELKDKFSRNRKVKALLFDTVSSLKRS